MCMCVSLVMGEEDEELQSWGWTDLSCYSSSPSDSEQEQRTPSSLMSRRSLRLDDGLLDRRPPPRGSASLVVGGASWRSDRPRRSQRNSASCSESLLVDSPQNAVGQFLHNSSVNSVASDASLISSLLDESSIQESTLVETFWGLDQDADLNESTIIASESSTLIGSDSVYAKHSDQALSRLCCKDCNCPSAPKSDKETKTETSTIYYRGRKSRAGCMFRWINGQWSHMSSSSRLSKLFIVLLLLLLFSVSWYCPASIYSLLLGINIADIPGLSSVHSFLPLQSQSAEGAPEELVQSHPPSAEMLPQEAPAPSPAPPAGMDSEQHVQMEQSLRALWEEMEAAGRRAEESHKELLQLYTDLRQQASGPQRSEYDMELWMRGLMEQQLSLLRRQLNVERRLREQMRQQDLLLLKTQASRLDQLQLQLEQVTARSWELQGRNEADAAPPAALPDTSSSGVDKPSQDALQADVSRLEAALVDVKRDVDGLSGCQDGCQKLDRIQQTISEQVSGLIREEVRALVYGNQLTQGGVSVLPESLLQWLSQRFVGEADLKEALSSLESSILQKLSRWQRRHNKEETVKEDVLDVPGNAVTKEEVHVMVMEALKLFSQDRTGLADYALESGGGSILSTRCSETYETKAALLSLFGFPLWYFSQSPRTVIQPDVHPGNCWAFRGSTGFLVIQLSMKILPTAVTMEHVPKSLAPSGTLRSAPRDFSVYGLKDEDQDRGKLLGNYTYDEDGEDLQMFIISAENDEAFQIIEVQVLSNWGHPEYTCMYRFRVHGLPSDI
ncbi:SUN domain-containing protein 2-like [Xiphophorus hellerii]|uniref:SUN domain-containing protein 2-like n=1 Tax=Xiphophorus hellerii TaxID=8084 RepID=UPI0013B3BBCE|nr:SUN domain-containing protein 2-like [Xiphophorus hellerii]XP_032429332.1 SUN domain-containing protein 2-like [Xiphophorus hellerii]